MKRLLAALLLVCGAPTIAEVRPAPGTGDPRIQTVLYDPEQVIQLQVAIGYQLTLEFAPDERIENVAVGDSGAWQITSNKRGDHLFIKATQNGAATNMTVVTDARSYVFSLSAAYGGSTMLPFTVRIIYPPPASATPASEVQVEHTRYKVGGAKSLRPSGIDDDGVHTYLQWLPNQTLPAIFQVDPLGNETLINGMMRGDLFVIDSVANRLVFRIDGEIAYAVRQPKRRKR